MNEQQASGAAFESRAYWIHALTPLHVGAGRGIGFIDLPIAREAVTNWPFVPGSAVKGVLADYHGVTEGTRKANDRHHGAAFGRGGDDAANSGSLVFTDAHLVCLPVRSLYGTFAWCTCLLALERLRRDLANAHFGGSVDVPVFPHLEGTELPVLVSDTPASVLSDGAAQNARVYFEDLDFRAVPCDKARQWAAALGKSVFADDGWQKMFQERFAIVPDDIFSFLCETATQVDARVKIDDDTKTVANGQLWYEESLPVESILAGLVWCGPVFGKNGDRAALMNEFCSGGVPIQLGGKATVGRGQVQMTFGNSAAGGVSSQEGKKKE